METGSRGQSRTCYHRGRGRGRAGALQPRRGHPVTVLRTKAAPGSRWSAPAGADKPRARRRQGGTAESGGDRRHRRHPSLQVPCVCVRPHSPFPYSVKMFEDFFRSKTKQNNPGLVHLRRAARAGSRTHNLLIFPANIGELHNGI